MSAARIDLEHDWGRTFDRTFTLEDEAADATTFSRTEMVIRDRYAVPSDADNSTAAVRVSTDDAGPPIVPNGNTIRVVVSATLLRALNPRKTYYYALYSLTPQGLFEHSKGLFSNVPSAGA